MTASENSSIKKPDPLLRVVGFFCILSAFLACGGEWTNGDGPKVSCRFSDVPFSTAREITLSADGEALYVLDIYGSVYAFNRNGARVCAFEPVRTPENPDARLPVTAAEKIQNVGSFLYYYDGISLLRYDDAKWNCDVSLSSMALSASYVYGAASAGISKLKIGAGGCSKTGTSFPAARVMALDARAGMVATVETSGALSDAPERFSLYDADGSLRARTALASGENANSLSFCSATRLRLGSAFAVLLDAKCGNLGVFDLSGGLLHRQKLSDMGVRNAVDIDVLGDDLYILTSSLVEPLYFLDLASYAFGEESI